MEEAQNGATWEDLERPGETAPPPFVTISPERQGLLDEIENLRQKAKLSEQQVKDWVGKAHHVEWADQTLDQLRKTRDALLKQVP